MKYFKLFLALGIFLILCSIAWADIPHGINLQGILDSAGNPLANRTVSVEFKIYDDSVGGNVLWSESTSVTTNAGGLFSAFAGNPIPIPDSAFDDTLRWLGIKVGTDAEMTPRQQIVSNAYAYRVGTVDGATGGNIFGDVQLHSTLKVGDLAGETGRLEITDGHSAVIVLDSTGYVGIGGVVGEGAAVGIGTQTPLSQLHLESSNPIADGIRIYNTSASGDPNIHFLTDGVFQYTLGVDNDDADKFQISAGSTLNSSECLTITSTGNVGIGTTTPGQFTNTKLDIVGRTSMRPVLGDSTKVLIFDYAPGDAMRIYTDAVSGTPKNLILGTYPNGPLDQLFLQQSTGNVGIGTSSPQGALDVSSTTGAFIVPRMTTAQRNALTAVNGMIIYNTTDNQFNFYENGAWVTK